MDRQLWNPGHRSVLTDQTFNTSVTISYNHSAGDPEIAVQPGVQNGATVYLYTYLAKAEYPMVRKGLDSQIRAIGMGSDDSEWSVGAPVGIYPGN
jgi:hypothetical protein